MSVSGVRGTQDVSSSVGVGLGQPAEGVVHREEALPSLVRLPECRNNPPMMGRRDRTSLISLGMLGSLGGLMGGLCGSWDRVRSLWRYDGSLRLKLRRRPRDGFSCLVWWLKLRSNILGG